MYSLFTFNSFSTGKAENNPDTDLAKDQSNTSTLRNKMFPLTDQTQVL